MDPAAISVTAAAALSVLQPYQPMIATKAARAETHIQVGDGAVAAWDWRRRICWSQKRPGRTFRL